MRLSCVLVMGIVGLAALPLQAATLKVQIADPSGQPLADAVVTLTPDSGEVAPAKPTPHDHFVDQVNETFVPLVEIIPVGETVIFRNSDRTRHHVYSFSPLGSFEFVLKPNELSAPVRLDKAGVIPVGCNIHDFMINYLFVTDSHWAAKSDDKGAVTLSDVPAGSYKVKFWHPRLRPGAAWPTQTVTVGAEPMTLTQTLPVMPAPRDDMDHERY